MCCTCCTCKLCVVLQVEMCVFKEHSKRSDLLLSASYSRAASVFSQKDKVNRSVLATLFSSNRLVRVTFLHVPASVSFDACYSSG
jgi:hypothetical protein